MKTTATSLYEHWPLRQFRAFLLVVEQEHSDHIHAESENDPARAWKPRSRQVICEQEIAEEENDEQREHKRMHIPGRFWMKEMRRKDVFFLFYATTWILLHPRACAAPKIGGGGGGRGTSGQIFRVPPIPWKKERTLISGAERSEEVKMPLFFILWACLLPWWWWLSFAILDFLSGLIRAIRKLRLTRFLIKYSQK